MDNFSFLFSPLLISLKIAFAATLSSSCIGILIAWQLSRYKGIIPAGLDALCSLPLVLPPTVIGYYLILFIGKHGFLGSVLAKWGINLMFSWQGAAVAAAIVIFPLIYKSSRAALDQVDHSLEDTARTLGASEARVFFTISLPLAWKGIFAGISLAFARGMGEFGATLMIAGNIPGKTQSLALATYAAFQAGDDTQATILAVFTSIFCACFLLFAEIILKSRY